MGISLHPQCAKCGKDMAPNQMRAIENGQKFVCKECYEQTNATDGPFGSVDKSKLRQPTEESKPSEVITNDNHFFESKEYICNSCNYRFKRSPEFVIHTCPFCGKNGTVEQKVERQAQELLEE